jgi:hypothetical protein
VRGRRGGGDAADDQALAYFLPGILYNAGYAVVLAFSCLIRLAAGRLHGRQRHRRPDGLARRPADRALCTADLAAGAAVPRSACCVQGPVWLAGHQGAIRPSSAVLRSWAAQASWAGRSRSARGRDGLAARPQRDAARARPAAA